MIATTTDSLHLAGYQVHFFTLENGVEIACLPVWLKKHFLCSVVSSNYYKYCF